MKFYDKINDKNLFDEFGLIIQTGTAKLLKFPKRKDSLSYDWQDENGMQYDLQDPKFEDKEVVLQCAIIADNDSEFWQKYNALFAELSKPNYQQLYIYDHSKTYDIFYKDSDDFEKATKRLKNIDKIFVKFNLIIQVK